MNVDSLLAVFTLNGATPLKLAFALGDAFYACGVVAPPTTHDLTSVRPSGCLVTDPTSSAQRTWTAQKANDYWLNTDE